MIHTHTYELWDGKTVVGHYHSTVLLTGKSISVSIFNVSNDPSKGFKTIKIPLRSRVVTDNGIDKHSRLVLDVSKKSKPQLNILLGRKGEL